MCSTVHIPVQIADINPESAAQVAAEIEALGGQAASVACDVADSSQQLAAFRLHMQRFGRLDYALLNAGGFTITSARPHLQP